VPNVELFFEVAWFNYDVVDRGPVCSALREYTRG